MKSFNPITALLLVAFSMIITGCPLSTKYPLANQNEAITLDKTLIGHWMADKIGAEAKEVNVEAGSEKNTYKIKVLETGEMYSPETSEYKGWLTEIKGLKLLVLQETGVKADKEKPFYVYAVSAAGNKLSLKDISLKVKGVDAITSTNTYKEEVIASMNHEEFFGDEITYHKK